jgi:hypothetical protein
MKKNLGIFGTAGKTATHLLGSVGNTAEVVEKTTHLAVEALEPLGIELGTETQKAKVEAIKYQLKAVGELVALGMTKEEALAVLN